MPYPPDPNQTDRAGPTRAEIRQDRLLSRVVSGKVLKAYRLVLAQNGKASNELLEILELLDSAIRDLNAMEAL